MGETSACRSDAHRTQPRGTGCPSGDRSCVFSQSSRMPVRWRRILAGSNTSVRLPRSFRPTSPSNRGKTGDFAHCPEVLVPLTVDWCSDQFGLLVSIGFARSDAPVEQDTPRKRNSGIDGHGQTSLCITTSSGNDRLPVWPFCTLTESRPSASVTGGQRVTRSVGARDRRTLMFPVALACHCFNLSDSCLNRRTRWVIALLAPPRHFAAPNHRSHSAVNTLRGHWYL